jgi:hypothetical protein
MSDNSKYFDFQSFAFFTIVVNVLFSSQFNDLSYLSFTSLQNVVKRLFASSNADPEHALIGTFQIGSLAVFSVVYFLMAALIAGSTFAAGLVRFSSKDHS